MRYRYDFLKALYTQRKCHSANQLWIFRHEMIETDRRYIKLYLYCRDTSKQLQQVVFHIQGNDTNETIEIHDFHKIKKSYYPYLRECYIPCTQEEVQVEIQAYTLDGVSYRFEAETCLVQLNEQQLDAKRAALLLEQMDITIMPAIYTEGYLCACGHFHSLQTDCLNCHRSYDDNSKLMEKGQDALCKEAFLKKYITYSFWEQCHDETEFINKLQEEANALHIPLEEKDYRTFLTKAKLKKRNERVLLIVLIVLIGLLPFAYALVFSSPTYRYTYPSNQDQDWFSDESSNPYENYEDYEDNYYEDYEAPQENSFQYHSCYGTISDMVAYVSLYGSYDVLTSMSIEIEMTSGQSGIDFSTITELEKEQIKQSALESLHISGNEAGVAIDQSIYDQTLYFTLDLDLETISKDTLTKLGFPDLYHVSYTDALNALSSQMSCY